MRTLIHLSDVHFGRTDPVVVEAVQARLQDENPDFVVISGDFTQRARRTQFEAANAFVASLPGRKLMIPGNHDIPLWNVFARFLFPLSNYRRFITSDLSPMLRDSEVIIAGVNTARSFSWKGGRINKRQVQDVRSKLCDIGGNVVKIVVSHHPFDLPERHGDRELVGRARMAMKILAECGADVLLAGHLHQAYTGGTAKRYQIAGHSALVVQAGTATSTRLRGGSNSFNILRIDPPRVTVEILSWENHNGRFGVLEAKSYERHPVEGWVRIEAQEGVPPS